MGVNRGVNDEICAIVRKGTAASYFMKGSSAGFPTLGVATPQLVISREGNIVFGNNQWTAFVYRNAPQTPFLTWCDRNAGTSDYNHSSYTDFLAFSDPPVILRSAADGPVFFMVGVGYNITNNDILKSTDNGVTFVEVTTPPNPYLLSQDVTHETMMVSPDGLTLMLGDSLTPHRSSDAGATWGVIPGLSGSYFCFFPCGDSQHWITQGANAVKYSADGGSTWTDKTGDLNSWLPIGSGWKAVKIKAW